VADPKPEFTNNAWPFDPLGPPDDPFKAGDYVIIKGSLWQDNPHELDNATQLAGYSPPITGGQYRTRWDEAYPNHGGYLEIHPMDKIRRIRPGPPRRKHLAVVGLTASPMSKQTVDTVITPFDAGFVRLPGQSLHFREIIDTRFTQSDTIENHALTIEQDSRLRVRVTVAGAQAPLPAYEAAGTFKATYILWFE
jgi:hypothetical protein